MLNPRLQQQLKKQVDGSDCKCHLLSLMIYNWIENNIGNWSIVGFLVGVYVSDESELWQISSAMEQSW